MSVERRRALAPLALLALLGCAKVLGLPERSVGEADAGLDASVDARIPMCRASARECMSVLRPRVCSAEGTWVDEPPCKPGLEECAMEGAACVPCRARPAELGAWTSRSPIVAASARYLTTMAFDPARGEIVLFGGLLEANEDSAIGDTWLWNGTTWSGALPVRSPSRRFASAMVTDRERGEIVLFGGEDFRYFMLADTWVWNGRDTSWTQKCGPGQAKCGPSVRMMHAMAYDAARRRVVLVGGGKTLVEPMPKPVSAAMSDTWEWDGSTWREVCGDASPPCALPGLRGASMTYDRARKRIVLFGGEEERAGMAAKLVDRVWEYDGASWAKREDITNVPPARSFASMTYDDVRERVVLHGGVAGLGGFMFGDTWEFDGNCWKDVTSADAPPLRSLFASSYDAARAELVTFGGSRDPTEGDAIADTVVRPSPSP